MKVRPNRHEENVIHKVYTSVPSSHIEKKNQGTDKHAITGLLMSSTIELAEVRLLAKLRRCVWTSSTTFRSCSSPTPTPSLVVVVMVCMPVARSRERPRQSKFQACSAIVVPSPKTESMSARQSSCA